MSKAAIRLARGCLGAAELQEVAQAFEYGYFGLAYKVDEFEKVLSEYFGGRLVVALSSGTAALHVSLEAMGIGDGDEVILPSLTFVGAFQAVLATGATPVSCDVRDADLTIDVEDCSRRITSRTRAIMPMHYAGNPCDMEALLRLGNDRGLRVVEDAAHAFGTTHDSRRIGSFGDVACFSFDSIKTITCGEGGAVVSDSAELTALIKQKRLLGMNRPRHSSPSWKDRQAPVEVSTQGYRYHMSNINAAIGLAQFRKAEGFIDRRRAICRIYDQMFAGNASIRTLPIDYSSVAPHVYAIRLPANRRDEVRAGLEAEGIETGINYFPNHHHPLFRRDGLQLPVTDRAYSELLNLPLHVALTDDDVITVANAVTTAVSKG